MASWCCFNQMFSVKFYNNNFFFALDRWNMRTSHFTPETIKEGKAHRAMKMYDRFGWRVSVFSFFGISGTSGTIVVHKRVLCRDMLRWAHIHRHTHTPKTCCTHKHAYGISLEAWWRSFAFVFVFLVHNFFFFFVVIVVFDKLAVRRILSILALALLRRVCIYSHNHSIPFRLAQRCGCGTVILKTPNLKESPLAIYNVNNNAHTEIFERINNIKGGVARAKHSANCWCCCSAVVQHISRAQRVFVSGRTNEQYPL